MSELVIPAITGVLGAFSGAIGAYVIVKRYVNFDFLMNLSSEILDEIATNKDLQQRIYLVGAILGQGVKGGIGLQGKGGKFKMDDLFGLAIQQFLPKIFGQKDEQQPQGGQTSTESLKFPY